MLLLGVLLLSGMGRLVPGAQFFGPWEPIFQGVEHMVGTNTPGGADFPNLFVAHTIRVDLNDPDVRLFSTPRISGFVSGSRETAGYTVSDFLRLNNLQVAINANFFDPQDYYLPGGTPMVLSGLAVSEGEVVSEQRSSSYAAAVVFDAAKHGQIIHTNWPAAPNDGIHTAVSGMYSLLVNGVNVGRGGGGFIHQTNPRTAVGLSQDGRYLFLLTIDGRQDGYSDGAYDYETAGWLFLLGAHNAVNMDGGGSTTMVMLDSTGAPRTLNRSSAVANDPRGRQRTVGSHFGVFSKPVRGFINDVAVVPDDKTAVVSWTTTQPATSQVEYGPTADFGSASPMDGTLATNHSVLLSGLSPSTAYYYRVKSSAMGADHSSATLLFTTTNYVSTNRIFDLSKTWKFTEASQDGVDWAASGFDDTAWHGPDIGLFWVDSRAAGPNLEVQPKGALLTGDAARGGLPYPSYYFRTPFQLTSVSAGTVLKFSSWIDDGAVFYLNGAEFYRLRMVEAPEKIVNQTIAIGFPCEGDATCSDDFEISAESLPSLKAGENVLAVEVHNYNVSSPDITFGLTLSATQPLERNVRLSASHGSNGLSLSWEATGMTLQQAANPAGPWTDAPGPVTQSPAKVGTAESERYFRLRR